MRNTKLSNENDDMLPGSLCPSFVKINLALHVYIVKILTISVQNNWYNDGVEWHDAACYRTKQFICEDSDTMVRLAVSSHPNARLRK